MGAPKGNKNAVGNKGGGDHSYAAEKANYEMLEKMFLQEMAKEEVQQKLASGKYSIKDVFVSKAFAGNEKFITAMFNKLFPDKQDIDLKFGRKPNEALDKEEVDRLINVFKDEK